MSPDPETPALPQQEKELRDIIHGWMRWQMTVQELPPSDLYERSKSALSRDPIVPEAPQGDGVAMVRWLTKHQQWLEKVIEDYPQGSYQNDLDVVESLLELVEGAALPSSPQGWLDGKKEGE